MKPDQLSNCIAGIPFISSSMESLVLTEGFGKGLLAGAGLLGAGALGLSAISPETWSNVSNTIGGWGHNIHDTVGGWWNGDQGGTANSVGNTAATSAAPADQAATPAAKQPAQTNSAAPADQAATPAAKQAAPDNPATSANQAASAAPADQAATPAAKQPAPANSAAPADQAATPAAKQPVPANPAANTGNVGSNSPKSTSESINDRLKRSSFKLDTPLSSTSEPAPLPMKSDSPRPSVFGPPNSNTAESAPPQNQTSTNSPNIGNTTSKNSGSTTGSGSLQAPQLPTGKDKEFDWHKARMISGTGRNAIGIASGAINIGLARQRMETAQHQARSAKANADVAENNAAHQLSNKPMAGNTRGRTAQQQSSQTRTA